MVEAAAVFTIDQFNALAEHEAQRVLKSICASTTWQEAMLAGMPYANFIDLETMAADLWSLTDESSLVEAFNGYAEASNSGDYRQLFSNASEQSISMMIELSIQYSAKFGFSFVASDSALDADSLLAELNYRVCNHRGDELDNAASALGSIIKRKVGEIFVDKKSNLKTIISDSCLGKAAINVALSLFGADGQKIATALTNDQGGVDNWSAPVYLSAGQYHLQVDSGAYFKVNELESLYPSIIIHFEVDDAEKDYHIQLSIGPYGYSTGLLA